MMPRLTLLVVFIAAAGFALWGEAKLARMTALHGAALHLAETRLAAIVRAGKVELRPAPAPAAPRAARRIPAKAIHVKDLLATYPDYLELRHKSMLARALRDYRRGIAQLGLPQEKQRQLLELLAARFDAKQFAVAEWTYANKSNPNPSEVDASPRVAAADQQIVDLIGAEAWGKLQDSAVIADVRRTNFIMPAALEDAGLPLNDAQSDALATAIFESNKQYPGGSRYQNPDPATGLAPANQAILDRLRGQLSPGQIDVLSGYLRDSDRFRTETDHTTVYRIEGGLKDACGPALSWKLWPRLPGGHPPRPSLRDSASPHHLRASRSVNARCVGMDGDSFSEDTPTHANPPGAVFQAKSGLHSFSKPPLSDLLGLRNGKTAP